MNDMSDDNRRALVNHIEYLLMGRLNAAITMQVRLRKWWGLDCSINAEKGAVTLLDKRIVQRYGVEPVSAAYDGSNYYVYALMRGDVAELMPSCVRNAYLILCIEGHFGVGGLMVYNGVRDIKGWEFLVCDALNEVVDTRELKQVADRLGDEVLRQLEKDLEIYLTVCG